jgi:hypothetical protein
MYVGPNSTGQDKGGLNRAFSGRVGSDRVGSVLLKFPRLYIVFMKSTAWYQVVRDNFDRFPRSKITDYNLIKSLHTTDSANPLTRT